MRSYAIFSRRPFRPALLNTLTSGYNFTQFAKDVVSGSTVGIVALPLAMAFAIASGCSPEKGLFTAIVAGFIISAIGGSRFQIGGPTGAFVVIVAGIIARHGYEGLVVATCMAGVILLVMGFCGLGRLLKFIPYPVTTGFTTGIALLIFTTQVKDLLGLELSEIPASFIPKVATLAQASPTAHLDSIAVAGATLATIFLTRKFFPRFPSHIAGILAASAVTMIFGLNVATIGTRFGGIPAELPSFALPSNLPDLAVTMFPDAITIALLAAIESLLSAVVADGMTGERHHSSTELIGQGVANIASSLFGGIPATGAIARTATNIRAGAFSPVSGMVHAIVLALFVKFFAPIASAIPLASLAGVLTYVAWDMSELPKFIHILRAPKSDAAVMVSTFLLTVLIDLTVGVQFGVVLAALLLVGRISDATQFQNWERTKAAPVTHTPSLNSEIEVYEINGPFFFGCADRFSQTFSLMRKPPRVIIFRMRHVHTIDATALHAIELVLLQMQQLNVHVMFSGVDPSIQKQMIRFGLLSFISNDDISHSFGTAWKKAHELAEEQTASPVSNPAVA
ncbi:SulP family inorganic anion transporter [Halodesulfovibrio marinisediminis]|uniref:Sulfate permease, SulP family n=1 Tax=Halodesulfovibrio marinisediminis DSM 17456 TaxID=1121457 RepID=A0A1N6DKV5_9BACT|nr:SulP family inorganic anion transporter [Halodesulfovibrio marinisediminis]SIN71412.1 sulfate permease, SulP family [Halodesulfovibrio marinisediminis DSM 17456]